MSGRSSTPAKTRVCLGRKRPCAWLAPPRTVRQRGDVAATDGPLPALPGNGVANVSVFNVEHALVRAPPAVSCSSLAGLHIQASLARKRSHDFFRRFA